VQAALQLFILLLAAAVETLQLLEQQLRVEEGLAAMIRATELLVVLAAAPLLIIAE
jgi:hypothetical protein